MLFKSITQNAPAYLRSLKMSRGYFVLLPLFSACTLSTTHTASVTSTSSSSSNSPTQSLSFTQQPSASSTAGIALYRQPTVTLYDSSNAIILTGSDSVALEAYSDSTCSTTPIPLARDNTTKTLTGTRFVNASNGVATFSNLILTRAGTLYLKASATGFTSACSRAIATVSNVASVTKTTFTVPSTTVTLGSSLTATVTAKDIFENPNPSGSIGFSSSVVSGAGTWQATATSVGNGVYTNAFTATSPGLITLSATINGVTVTQTQNINALNISPALWSGFGGGAGLLTSTSNSPIGTAVAYTSAYAATGPDANTYWVGGQELGKATLWNFSPTGTLRKKIVLNDLDSGTNPFTLFNVTGNGSASTFNVVRKLLVLSDGRVTFVGDGGADGENCISYVCRVLPDGSLDASFGDGVYDPAHPNTLDFTAGTGCNLYGIQTLPKVGGAVGGANDTACNRAMKTFGWGGAFVAETDPQNISEVYLTGLASDANGNLYVTANYVNKNDTLNTDANLFDDIDSYANLYAFTSYGTGSDGHWGLSTFWGNGVSQGNQANSGQAYFTDITISGSDIFVAGVYQYSARLHGGYPALWHTDLTGKTGSGNSYPGFAAVFIEGGVQRSTPDGGGGYNTLSPGSMPLKVNVDGSNVILSGYRYADSNNYFANYPSTPAHTYQAKSSMALWKLKPNPGNADPKNSAFWVTNSEKYMLDTAFNSTGIYMERGTGSTIDSTLAQKMDFASGVLVNGTKYIITGAQSTAANSADFALWSINTDGSNAARFTHDSAAGGNGYDAGYNTIIDPNNGHLFSVGTSTAAGNTSDISIWSVLNIP